MTDKRAADAPKKKLAASQSRECGNCGVSEEAHGKPLSACSRCKLAYYCGRECQATHWKAGHKQFCVAAADRTPSAAANAAKVVEVTGASTATAVASGAKCTICLDPIAQPEACTLACGHAFHVCCVSSLRAFGSTGAASVCPNCRHALPPGLAREVDAARRAFDSAETAALGWCLRSPLVEERRSAWEAARPALRAEAVAAVAVFRRVVEVGMGAGADPAAVTTAQCYLAIALDSGTEGLDQVDEDQARRLFKAAAEAGHAEAQFGYAQMAEQGRGAEGGGVGGSSQKHKASAPSVALALAWFRAAALQGHVEAQFHLGGLLEQAHAEATPGEGQAWIAKAARAGCPEAQFNYGTKLLERHMPDMAGARAAAGPWLVAASAQGIEPAMLLCETLGLSWPGKDPRGGGPRKAPKGKKKRR